MNLVKLQRQLLSVSKNHKYLSTLPEYTEVPEYPPIEDLSYESKKKKKVQNWSDTVRAVRTVEEKQIKLNMPKYYGWKSIMFGDKLVPYGALPLVQYCTRTHLQESAPPSLPQDPSTAQLDKELQQIQPLIEDAILFQHDILNSNDIYNKELTPCERDNMLADSVVKQINRIILNNMSSLPHLADCQVDLEPRHEAFWFIGGIDPPTHCKKSREGLEWTKHLADDPIDRAAQYIGEPSLTVRCSQPLEPRISLTESENPSLEIPNFTYDPRVIGYNSAHRHGTNIPGFWPGDRHPWGLLSYQRAGHMRNRSETFGSRDDEEALHAHAILSSFSWLLSQASYHGFTTYNELTYPLTAQTVVTDGREFSFYTYQLNTIVLHGTSECKRKNIIWAGPRLKLYETIENDKVVGFNGDVLKQLLTYYANAPVDKSKTINLQPYLHQDRIVANIADEEKREWLEKQYKHMMANKPRHRKDHLYEIYHWEKIYKIDHKTRVMEPRRRPFELKTNPWARTYDDASPIYLPKSLRPDGPKSKPKFYKNYWP